MDVKVHSLSYLLEERPSLFSRAAYGPKGRERVKSVLLLNKVSLTLPPGSVSVVLGVGKGHRYLLECIALRRQDGQMAGKLQYDGIARKRDFYRDIAFVNDFGFAHFGSLTVFDYLYFGARLRLSLGVVECRERARQACRTVGLDGSLQLHQLGPAELRIACIALEIVGNPTLVIALDPIKGLDAAGALEVMKVLRTIAKRVSMPTTVLYNLPSLSEDMVPLTDRWTVFTGNTIGYACALTDFAPEVKPQLNKVWSDISLLLAAEAAREPSDVFDPLDYSAQGGNACVRALERTFDALDALIEASHAPPGTVTSTKDQAPTSSKKVTTGPGSEADERKSADFVIEHGKFKGGFLPRLSSAGVPSSRSTREGDVYSVTRRLAETGDGVEGLPVRVPKALYLEVWILLTRAVQNHARNMNGLLLGLVRFTLAAILLSCLVLHEGNKLGAADLVTSPNTGLIDMHAYNVSGILFGVVALSLVSTAFAVPYLHSTAHLIKAEVASGLASTWSGWMALVLVDSALYLGACWAVSAVIYAIVEIQGPMVTYCWVLFLVTLCGYSLAATSAIWFRSLRLAWLTFATVGATCLIFSGFLQRLGSLGGLWAFLAAVSFTRWAYEALSIIAFRDAPDQDAYLELFGFDNTKAMFCTVWLVLWILMLQVLVVLGLMPPMFSLKLTATLRAQSRASEDSNVSSVDGAADAPHGLQSVNMKERLDAIWEAARAIAQTPIKKPKRRRASKSSTKPAADSIASLEEGYQPPSLPEDENEEVTLQFANVNTMFGAYMHIHNHDEADKPSGPPARPATADAAIQNTTSYSNSIRKKGSLKMGPGAGESDRPKTAPDSAQAFQSPSRAPLLGPVEDSPGVTMSPLTAPTRTGGQRGDEGTQRGTELSALRTRLSEDSHADTVESQPVSASAGQVVHIPPQMSTALSFSRLKFVPEGQEHAAPSLQGVSYKILPGACCCIVEGNGEGNSSLLLQLLAGKLRVPGKTTGVIRANDQRMGTDLRYLNAGYVQRGDIAGVNALTVRQVLRYAAYLRRTDQSEISSADLLRNHFMHTTVHTITELMYENASAESLVGKSFDIEHRINEVLLMTGLAEVSDRAVGAATPLTEDVALADALPAAQPSLMLRNLAQLRHGATFGLHPAARAGNARGISASQLRCLTIATELVNRPGLLFLEDPFADLQWQDAEQVAAMLRNLSRGGRTVICSAEKPCQRVLSYMTDLMLLGGGLLVYSSPTDAMVTYFANIGFERPPGQNDLDFVLDIAADRGKMKLVGGKRGNTLSPEDLADLNRSLVNIRAGRQKGDDAFAQDTAAEGVEEVLHHGAVKTAADPAEARASYGRSVLKRAVVLPTWDTAVVLAARGLQSLLANKTLITRHCGQCLLAGVLLGSVWWDIDEGNYQARISLFATAYMFINLFTVDAIEGITQGKATFLRESTAEASTHSAYFLADCLPLYCLQCVGCLLFTAPLYIMAGLRPGLGYFLYFNTVTLLSVYCNTCLAYLLTMLTDTRLACKLLFGGVALPLQLLMAGFLVLLRTMPNWLSWGASICPMYFYMAGVFRNEFLNNRDALGDVSYSNLRVQYDYYSNQATCLVVLLFIGLVYKGLWLVSVRYYGVRRRRAVLQQVYGARRKARKLIKAGLRWSERTGTQYQRAEHAGGFKDSSRAPSPGGSVANSNAGGDDEDEAEVDFGNGFHSARC